MAQGLCLPEERVSGSGSDSSEARPRSSPCPVFPPNGNQSMFNKAGLARGLHKLHEGSIEDWDRHVYWYLDDQGQSFSTN